MTNQQARRFMLLKQGLYGKPRFVGKEGICSYIDQAGCIQFDPVDVCGRNPDLVLLARVQGYEKQMLYELLYQERRLIDYWDKNMSIYSIDDWPCFLRHRLKFQNSDLSRESIHKVSDIIKEAIQEKGHISSKELDLGHQVNWYWAPTSLARAAMEALYYEGELMIHHKRKSIRHYGLTSQLMPQDILDARDPYPDLNAHHAWRVKRRIGAVGLLWNKASDAWLGIPEFKGADRLRAFKTLIDKSHLIEIAVDGIDAPLFALAEDLPLVKEALEDLPHPERMELIAPLDNMMWDRKLIKAVFDFDYKWEIYTPEVQRKYGHYVLPLLWGTDFIGRTEIVRDKKSKMLIVKSYWPEDGHRSKKELKRMKRPFDACMKRFAAFNESDGYSIKAEQLRE